MNQSRVSVSSSQPASYIYNIVKGLIIIDKRGSMHTLFYQNSSYDRAALNTVISTVNLLPTVYLPLVIFLR